VIRRQLAGLTVVPRVDDQLIVYPEARPIVYDDVETVGSRVKVGCAGPAD
jgi:hypothetical protein